MEENAKPVVCVDEIVFDGQTEQGVELDYVLPDYCPDIFKVLSCALTPRIVSYNVSGDCRLNIDGIVYIKVLYLAENSDNVQCIDGRYTYSKTVDMSRKNSAAEPIDPIVTLQMKSDYCSCRAVSSRRIDVRGAVSCRIKAAASVEYALPEIPDGLQVRTTEVACCGKTLFAGKQMTIREDIDTGASGIAFIMQCNAVPKITDLRVIADKAVLKGTVTINALYGTPDAENPENSGAAATEKMTADIPISAILDIDGITSSHRTFPEISVMNCELIPRSDSGILSCELLVECRVRAQLEDTLSIATDVYSTEFDTELTSNVLKISAEPRTLSQNITVRTTLNSDKGEMRSVWDVSGELRNAVCRPDDNGGLTLSGQLFVTAYGVNTDGVPFYCEKQEPIEQKLSAENITADTLVDFTANVIDTGFSIKPDGELEVTSAITIEANLHDVRSVEAVDTVTIREDSPKPRSDEFALRICFTGEQCDCWSIAKRYNTTVAAIMEENDIESCDQPLEGMIIIPTA
ncbi:MAG: DUF3794 domain-containing protein [Oscillospiraceae bacterium]|nr:DUF3794 domain-containing protein [Oscillospiraceae bacterium]